MAIIKCKECGRQISDKAAACPGCGCPLAQKTQTIERTGKIIKLNVLASAVLTVIGLVLVMRCFGVFPGGQSAAALLFALIVTGVGMAWGIITEFVAWWKHG